jgi:hypothetical protein
MTVPQSAETPLIACDGSSGQSTRIASAAAVAATGQAVVRWFVVPEEFPVSWYAELAAVHLAVELAAGISGATITSDSTTVIEAISRLRSGTANPVTVAALTAIGNGAPALPNDMALVWEGPRSGTGGLRRRVAASGPGIIAHKLAITAYRLARDGLDPRENTALLLWIAGPHAGVTEANVDRAYRNWRRTGTLDMGPRPPFMQSRTRDGGARRPG